MANRLMYFAECIRLARKSTHVSTRGGSKVSFKLGSVLVKDGQIVSSAFNTTGKCAERRALAKSPRYARGAQEVYVARVQRGNGQIALARPCRYCMAALKVCDVRKVYYTTEEGWAEELIL